MTSQTEKTFVPYMGEDYVMVGPKTSIAFNVLVERDLVYRPDEGGLPQAVVAWQRDDSGLMLPWHTYLPQGSSQLPEDLQGLGLVDLAVKFHAGSLQRLGNLPKEFKIFRIDDIRPTSDYSYFVFMSDDEGGVVLLHQDLRASVSRTDGPIWDINSLMELSTSPQAVWTRGPEVDREHRAAEYRQWRAEGKIIFTDESAFMRAYTAMHAQQSAS